MFCIRFRCCSVFNNALGTQRVSCGLWDKHKSHFRIINYHYSLVRLLFFRTIKNLTFYQLAFGWVLLHCCWLKYCCIYRYGNNKVGPPSAHKSEKLDKIKWKLAIWNSSTSCWSEDEWYENDDELNVLRFLGLKRTLHRFVDKYLNNVEANKCIDDAKISQLHVAPLLRLWLLLKIRSSGSKWPPQTPIGTHDGQLQDIHMNRL